MQILRDGYFLEEEGEKSFLPLLETTGCVRNGECMVCRVIQSYACLPLHVALMVFSKTKVVQVGEGKGCECRECSACISPIPRNRSRWRARAADSQRERFLGSTLSSTTMEVCDLSFRLFVGQTVEWDCCEWNGEWRDDERMRVHEWDSIADNTSPRAFRMRKRIVRT